MCTLRKHGRQRSAWTGKKITLPEKAFIRLRPDGYYDGGARFRGIVLKTADGASLLRRTTPAVGRHAADPDALRPYVAIVRAEITTRWGTGEAHVARE